MRNIASPLAGFSMLGRLRSSVSAYAVLGFEPPLVFDFANEYYRTGGNATTFDNAITPVASTNATMVDSDGRLKWRPHNLLTYSEQFDNAAWSKVGTVTVTANNTASPSGSLTADRVEIAAASALAQTVVNAVGYTIAVWVKAGLSGLNSFRLQGNGNQASADLTATSEWQLFTFTPLATGSSSLWSINRNAAGDPVDVYIWGAHLYRSDLGGMVNNPDRGDSYVPTTSAARYLPRRGHHVYNGSAWVNKGLLVESESRTNLVTYSEDFTNVAWSKVGATVSANATTSPTGANTASKIVESSSTSEHLVWFTGFGVGLKTASTFFKAAERTQAAIYFYNATDGVSVAYFDLATGSVISGGGSIEPLGNGWYRCSLTRTSTASDSVYFCSAAGGSTSYAGNGTSGIYIYGAQLEAGSTPSSYIPTAGATATRAAETLTVPAANLPWPSPVVIGPELVTNGTFDTDTAWTKGTGWTINGGVAAHLGTTAGNLTQAVFTVGKVYQVTWTQSNGQFVAVYGNGLGTLLSNTDSNGTYSVLFTPTSSVNIDFRSAANGATIDNISVKEINPLAVSIQMKGEMTYADRGVSVSVDGITGEVIPLLWRLNSSNFIHYAMSTASTNTGLMWIEQNCLGALDSSGTTGSYYSPGINVPFNIASRHGSTFINGAVDGTALTADLTPVALPDLHATNLSLGYTFMGTISEFRMWADDLGNTGIAEASA